MTNRMKKILAIGFGAVLMAMVADKAMAADSGVWTTLNISGTVADNVTLNVEEQLRFGDITDLSLTDQRTKLSLGFGINETVGVSAGYLNTNSSEHRPFVGLAMALLRGGVNIDSASAIELSGFDTLSGRTSLTASAVVNGLTLDLSDEVRLNEDGLIHNRASLGVTRSVTSNVAVNMYYMLNSTGTDLSSTAHIIGLGLGVSL